MNGQGAGHRPEAQIPDKMPLVSADADQLNQVFLNLLLNARDAVTKTEEDIGHIRISVREASFEEEDLATHSSSPPGDYLLVQVSDDGVGMDEETRLRVFEPFFTTKEVGRGTGLGLATVYGTVEQHQGWIECKSQPGVGTTFSVYLPVFQGEAADSEADSPVAVTTGAPRRSSSSRTTRMFGGPWCVCWRDTDIPSLWRGTAWRRGSCFSGSGKIST